MLPLISTALDKVLHFSFESALISNYTKGSFRNNLFRRSITWPDGVIPFGVEVLALDGQAAHHGVGDFDAFGKGSSCVSAC
jgi:hypothetical protein